MKRYISNPILVIEKAIQSVVQDIMSIMESPNKDLKNLKTAPILVRK